VAPAAGRGIACAGADAAQAASPMSELWELRCEQKRGTFLVKTYLPNFVLPLHLTSRVNRTPFSPSQPATDFHPLSRHVEAKLQISLRAKVAEGLLLPDADLWFAYTQHSFWQVWTAADSRPFRSTDYQPEAIYVVPMPARLGELPGGWRWRMLQLGVVHQSNGQSDPLSRSWNRLYAGAGFERGEVGLQVQLLHRLTEPGGDDNPDLTTYIGGAELVATWQPGPATAVLTWRTGHPIRRGFVQLDWIFPVRRVQPLGLRWYAQLFSGYGETLLDYNVRQTSFGFGVSLFHF
ncbi:MAG TPA: phospholipase A, partial [Ideonella sp.]|nr:phospholipase A [Ideonella sp.]